MDIRKLDFLEIDKLKTTGLRALKRHFKIRV